MDPAQDVAQPKQEGRQKQQLGHGNSTEKATLTGPFSGVAKDTLAVIIPEGNERSVSYAQLYDDVVSFQKELAGQ